MRWPVLAGRAFHPFRRAASNTAGRISLSNALDTLPEPQDSPPASPQRSSKASFAAAQAIRMCLKNGGFSDGFFVFNSLRFAAHTHSSLPFKTPGIEHSRTEFEAAALRFSPDVPTRLSAHALLHGLLRHDLAQPAFEFSKLMMAEGIQLRSTTMEAIMKSILGPTSIRKLHPRAIPLPRRFIPLNTASQALLLRPSLMSDDRTRLALELLFLARRHRQRRTDHMFKLFMAATLLQGELVILSLLFGWTCREWQTSYSLASDLAALAPDDELHSEPQIAAVKLRFEHLHRERLFPSAAVLEDIVHAINTVLGPDSRASQDLDQNRRVALQALANLAGLLERHQIPFSQVSGLIRAMYRCPRLDEDVWIVGLGGCPERIKANDYFHRVLYKLLDTLPTEPRPERFPAHRTTIMQGRKYPVLPPLSQSSSNTILHYALRHRVSPHLASKITAHIDRVRGNFGPSTATANILLRSGTLMQRRDIVAATLHSIGDFKFTPEIPLPGGSPVAVISTAPAFVGPHHTKYGFVSDVSETGASLGRVEHESLHIPIMASCEADLYTLSSYITHLVASGKPGAVINILYTLLPELDTKLFPTNSERKEDRRAGRAALMAMLQRSITLGPYFFTAVLDALTKSGQFRLADRVWHIAKKAEWCSWTRNHVPDCNPWVFGPQVYTIMLRAYGTLARRQKAWDITLGDRISWRTSRNSIWAFFIYQCQQLPKPLSPDHVLDVLRKIMTRAAFDVFQRFVDMPHRYAALPERLKWLRPEELPRPDALFFNAALKTFRPRPGPRSEAHYERLNVEMETRFADNRTQPHVDWNDPLQAVVETMMGAGFPLPHGLRHIFGNRLDHLDLSAPPGLPTTPIAFGELQRAYHPLNLPTPKERGMPLSKAYDIYRLKRAQRRIERRRWRVATSITRRKGKPASARGNST
ncbi:hypothetical protein MKEN_00059400 [Mycena kentingensis (nom. inval.)]|nr:hypothetical protein MKEN_00059400 [Mycena kentingensis (nom. inval.)]